MAKIQIKSERLTPFGGLFSIMEQFDPTLSSIVYCLKSHCGVRGYVGRSGCFKFKLSANSVMRGRVNAIRMFKGLVADLGNNTFTLKQHPLNSVCKIGTTLHNKIINAEFSLQSASHNSRINHQRHCWWQIR